MGTFKKHYPLIIVLILWGLILAACLMLSLKHNQGHLVYALDDAYIHMAMAKNFVQHGVWGVTRYDFTSTSSSLLYTLLLSFVYFLFGVNEVAPLILNLIFGFLICILSYVILRKYFLPPFVIFLILLLIVFFTPLTWLVFCGQEHILHLLLSVAFFYISAQMLAQKKSGVSGFVSLAALTPLLTMSRYEGLFLLFVVCALFVARRRLPEALFLGGLGILPIAIYGFISISRGWYFLPNSVLLKGAMPNFSSLWGIVNALGYTGYTNILIAPHLLSPIIFILFVSILRFMEDKECWDEKQFLAIIFIMTALLHLQFARAGWFFKSIVFYNIRYDAYLVCLEMLVIGILLNACLFKKFHFRWDKKLLPLYVTMVFLAICIFGHLTQRGLYSLAKTPLATKNIYEQQYQMGLFLKKFYQKKVIAVNDIGAVNYLADIKILDINGLATVEIASAKLNKFRITPRIHELARKKRVAIAIVFEGWYPPDLFSPWIKVGQWKILHNVICGTDTVSFYALNPSEVDNLIENLKKFSSRLPRKVVQSGKYMSMGF